MEKCGEGEGVKKSGKLKPKWKGKHKAILCVFKMRQLTETTKAREDQEEDEGNNKLKE